MSNQSHVRGPCLLLTPMVCRIARVLCRETSLLSANHPLSIYLGVNTLQNHGKCANIATACRVSRTFDLTIPGLVTLLSRCGVNPLFV
ncbi:hypothetical protein SUGI_0787500 [Cryptomeria japonica]|nr:hypothetical protein SUGI_0787500 [Cryptomeria japonica]